jgi:multicomponent Na+:H+ antiporter subunit G
MTDIIAGVLILAGATFTLIASVGVIRLPDVLTRMHASTKAGTLGASLILAAAVVLFGDMSTLAKCVVAVLFLLLTAPLAAHMIGRASLDRDRHPRL